MKSRITIAVVIALLTGGLGAAVSPAQAAATQIVDAPGSTVRAIAVAPDGTQYVGGDFTTVGAATGGFASVATSDAATVNRSWPSVTGAVNAMVSDGSGGWYIAGDFSKVGDQARSNLARITSSGTVDPDFAPVVGSAIRALIKVGSTVYFAGDFTTVAGSTRARAAAVNATTGALTGWNPSLNNNVNALAASGSTIYVGGQFTTVAGGATTRNRAAAFSAYTSEESPGGVVTGWDPNLSSNVFALAVSGSTVYVGGQFSGLNSVNGNLTRNAIAAVDTVNGTATGWNPGFNNIVRTIAVSGSTVYVGGDFTLSNGTIPSVTRNRAAAVDATTGVVNGWNPNFSGSVRQIVVDDSTVYVGGSFNGTNSVNGSTIRNRAAAVSAYTDQASPGGTVLGWNPNLGGSAGAVLALGVTNSTVALGGAFVLANQVTRNRAAAFDSSGRVTDWNPNLGGNVMALVLSGSTVYLGGGFSGTNSVNGTTTRNRAAAVDATTGAVTDWDPNFSNTVRTIRLSGSTVYVGGDFSGANSVNGSVTRNRAAAVNTTTGTATDWNPDFNDAVLTIAVSGSTVYVGGQFTTVGGSTTTRNRAAAVDATTGAVTDWDPNLSGAVYTLAVSGSIVYLAGDFNGVNSVNGTTTRNRAAAVDATTGMVNGWDPDITSYVYALVVAGSTVYTGGFITTVNGSTARGRAAAFSAYTSEASPGGVVNDWNPNLNFNAFALAVSGAKVYVGGSFFTVAGETLNPGRAYYTVTSAVRQAQSITFAALSDWSLGGGTRTVSATASSGLPVSFSSLTPATCTVSGTSVSMVAKGTCTVRASQSGDDVYAAATPVDQSFTVTLNPAQPSSMTRDGTSVTWPVVGGAQSYFVVYRPVGSTQAWGVYAASVSTPQVWLTNTKKKKCSPANAALGYTNCALPYGFVKGTSYEFTVYSRNAAGVSSSRPLVPLMTFTP